MAVSATMLIASCRRASEGLEPGELTGQSLAGETGQSAWFAEVANRTGLDSQGAG